MNRDLLDYYAHPGPLTTLFDTAANAALLAGFPRVLPDMIRAVQGNMIHVFWAERYGVCHEEDRLAELQIRTAEAMLQAIYAAAATPLVIPRPNESKLVGNCRDFTVMTVALLRRSGVPARARCGFATYFFPDRYEDHWVAEYWSDEQERWVMVDAQLDEFQREVLGITFDPLDVPRGGPDASGFVTGAHAWELVRRGDVDPNAFGIFDMRGIGFVVGDLVRDVAALNKVELLPWDIWGIMQTGDAGYTAEETAFLNRTAAFIEGDDLPALRELYGADERLRVPSVISSWIGGADPVFVTVAHERGYRAPDGG